MWKCGERLLKLKNPPAEGIDCLDAHIDAGDTAFFYPPAEVHPLWINGGLSQKKENQEITVEKR